MISDIQGLDLALRRAQRGKGQTQDNPSVGCLIVCDAGKVVGLAHTASGGRPHAEILALSQANTSASGGTAFITLEPCGHPGRSGACSTALLESGLRRIVVGSRDDNPLVSGNGIAALRAGGVEVVLIEHQGCRRHHLGFNRRVANKSPYIVMKIATSADGGMTRKGASAQVLITGAEVRRQVHILRAQSDVLVTGRGTMAMDKPQLNVRLPGFQGSAPPVKVLQRSELLTDLPANQVLIEAGPTLSSALFDQIDELHWYRSAAFFGDEAVRPTFLSKSPLDFAQDWPTYALIERRTFGDDTREIWRRKTCSQAL